MICCSYFQETSAETGKLQTNTWEDIPGIEVQARLMQMGGIKKQSLVALFWNILIIMRFPRYHEGNEPSLPAIVGKVRKAHFPPLHQQVQWREVDTGPEGDVVLLQWHF